MDVSLYHLASSIDPSPQTLSVSPATLLSTASSVIDLLIDQQIAATLLVKLPPGKIWTREILRYHQQAAVPHAIYSCNRKLQNSVAPTTLVTNQGRASEDQSPVISVQLAPDSQLTREYFLIVLSPQFCSLILAHRPALRRQAGGNTASQSDGRSIPTPNQKSHQTRLWAICSFQGRVIQQVLKGLKQAITLNQPQPTAIKIDPSHQPLAWDSVLDCSPAPSPVLLEQLLAKQICSQDEIWQRLTINRAAVALQLHNQELLNTLRLKDEFLSNLCQELRTPLTNMKTALSLLNSPQLKPPQRQRYLQLLNTECDRQNSLITGFLDLMQLDLVAEQTALQPIRVSDIVPGVVSTYQPIAQEKGIMLAYTVPLELPAVLCLSSWLKQIVINLLHNSIKFTPTGGQVWVRSRLQGDYVQLEFRDTGIGIAASEIPKIFDRFYRVRPVGHEDIAGAGLGLTIVQQLLLRCGGSISVKSKLGEGSVFNVLLPIAATLTPD